MAISWQTNQPVHTARLCSYLDAARPSDNDLPSIPIDESHANVIAFHEPFTLSIPTWIHFTEYRLITVQGTVREVLNSIYEVYQQPATEGEIYLANEEGNGSNGPKVIDQMDDVVVFEGWGYSEGTTCAYLFVKPLSQAYRP